MATSNATKKPVLASLEKTPPTGTKGIVTTEVDIDHYIKGLKVSNGMPQDDALELASSMLASVRQQLAAYIHRKPENLADALEGTNMLVSVAKSLVDATWNGKEVDVQGDSNDA